MEQLWCSIAQVGICFSIVLPTTIHRLSIVFPTHTGGSIVVCMESTPFVRHCNLVAIRLVCVVGRSVILFRQLVAFLLHHQQWSDRFQIITYPLLLLFFGSDHFQQSAVQGVVQHRIALSPAILPTSTFYTFLHSILVRFATTMSILRHPIPRIVF